MTRVVSDNNRNTLTPSQSVPHIQDIPVGEGVSVSEVIEHPSSEDSKYIKFIQGLSRSTIIQLAQWDAISRGIKGIKTS